MNNAIQHQVSCGGSVSVVFDEDNIFVFGDSKKPLQIVKNTKGIVKTCCSSGVVFGMTKDGVVWDVTKDKLYEKEWNDNKKDRIIPRDFDAFSERRLVVLGVNGGLKDTSESGMCKKLPEINGAEITVDKIACGWYFFLITDTCGNLYSCGYNTDGQCGRQCDDIEDRTIFYKVDFPHGRVEEISCGSYHSFAINDCGRVYSTGFNNNFQLGLGHGQRKVFRFQQLKTFSELVNNQRRKLKYIPEFKKASCGSAYCILQSKEDEFFFCGSNEYKQFGVPIATIKKIDHPIRIRVAGGKKVHHCVAGYWHTLLLMKDGTVYTAGYNSSNQLGKKKKYVDEFSIAEGCKVRLYGGTKPFVKQFSKYFDIKISCEV